MSSSIPAISDVLFYTPTDSYDYLTDNRPIYNLDSNLRSLAQAMVGIGYGEHTSVSGALLTAGKVVELVPGNGQIKYPDSTTVAATAILGIVTGTTNNSLNKVIWGSPLLDLNALGLSNIVSGATAGSFLKAAADGSGNLTAVTSFISTDLIIGKVKSWPFISIGKEGQNITVSDNTPLVNHFNLYGVSRVRNLSLLSSLDATPIQYTKSTIYQQDITTTNSLINAMAASLDLSNGQIIPDSTPAPTYGVDSWNWVVKEKYVRFLTTETTPSEAIDVLAGAPELRSSWPTISYQTTFASGVTNYELQSTGSGALDYTVNLDTFKQFKVYKYFQYAKVNQASPLYGKKTVVCTVFDNEGTQLGGETGRTLVFDFIAYNGSGLETSTNRVVITGSAATVLYANASVFPTSLLAS